MTSLLDKPYLLEEEETYEPPEDPESSTFSLTYPPSILSYSIDMSLEELGLRALQRLPRERAINGIHAFNEMRYVKNVVSLHDLLISVVSETSLCLIYARLLIRTRR